MRSIVFKYFLFVRKIVLNVSDRLVFVVCKDNLYSLLANTTVEKYRLKNMNVKKMTV
jgi:hypothetical protein